MLFWKSTKRRPCEVRISNHHNNPVFCGKPTKFRFADNEGSFAVCRRHRRELKK